MFQFREIFVRSRIHFWRDVLFLNFPRSQHVLAGDCGLEVIRNQLAEETAAVKKRLANVTLFRGCPAFGTMDCGGFRDCVY